MLEHVKGNLEVLLGEDLARGGTTELAQEGVVSAVEPLDVVRIDRVFHDLQEVTGQLGVADIAPHVVPHEEVIAREQRGGLWAEVGEHEPAEFLYAV